MAAVPEKAQDAGTIGSPAGRLGWMSEAGLGLACAIVIGIFFWAAGSGASTLGPEHAADAHYNRLVEGFRAGTLSLKQDVPAGLAQLADPYDPVASAPYRYSSQGLHDVSYYHGRLFLYFGVTPALVAFWPWVALTRHHLSHAQATAFFCAMGFLAAVLLLRSLWRRCFPEVHAAVVLAGVFALGLATSVPLMLQRPEFYEVAISSGYAMTMLALAATWQALRDSARRGWWLAAASLTFGLAVGARPSLLFGALILLLPLLLAATPASARDRWQIPWKMLVAALGPIVVIGAGLAAYNYFRFGDPLEFGQRYQLAGDRQASVRHFHFGYLGYNLRLYFLAPLQWSGAYPFVTDVPAAAAPAGHAELVENPLGLLINVPFVWLALAVPLGWRDRPLETRTRLRGLAAAVAFLFLSGAMVIGLFYTTSNRYEVEFAPALVFLAVMGMLSLERWGARRPAVQRIVIRSAWIALLLFSIAVNLLASVDRAAVECYSLGRSLIQSGRSAEAVAKLEASLRIKAGYADAHNKLGIALSQLGRVPEAMAQFTEAVRLAPADVPPRLNLATALAVSGRATEATEQFRQVLQLDPANALAHLNFGILLAESGHRQDAIDQFSTGVRLKPDEADLRAALGTVLLSAGRTSEAVAELREALRLRPDDAAVRAALRQAGAWPEPAGPER